MSFSLRTDHFQLCSEAVDEVVPSGVAPEEDEDDVEHEDEEAKRQLQGGEGDQGPEHLHPAQAKQAVLAPGEVSQAGLNPKSKIMHELNRIRKEKKKLSEVFKKGPSSFFQEQVAILLITRVVHLVGFL